MHKNVLCPPVSKLVRKCIVIGTQIVPVFFAVNGLLTRRINVSRVVFCSGMINYHVHDKNSLTNGVSGGRRGREGLHGVLSPQKNAFNERNSLRFQMSPLPPPHPRNKRWGTEDAQNTIPFSENPELTKLMFPLPSLE